MTRKRRATGQTIGSILAGFDQQIFRATKPAAELVESAKPLSAVAADDGSLLTIELPDVVLERSAEGSTLAGRDPIE